MYPFCSVAGAEVLAAGVEVSLDDVDGASLVSVETGSHSGDAVCETVSVLAKEPFDV
jgi:hypothetical protein